MEDLTERIMGMDTSTRNLKLWQIDPYCPVDWRAKDAAFLAAGQATHWWRENDSDVTEFAKYLRATAAAKIDQNRAATSPQWSAIRSAHEISCHGDPGRWRLEAELLTGRSNEEIADHCGLSSSTVAWYERLFFSVRDHIRANAYIIFEVIGRGHWTGFENHELDRLWKAFAYFGGGVVLDSLVNAFLGAWRPGQPATLAIYFQEGCQAPLEMQAAIAVHAIPVNEETDRAFTQLHAQLQEIEKTMPSSEAMAAMNELKRETIRLWRVGPLAMRYAQQRLAGQGDCTTGPAGVDQRLLREQAATQHRQPCPGFEPTAN